MCIYHIFLNHSSVGGHLGCFHVWVIISSVFVNIGVCVFFQIRIIVFSRYISMNGIAGLYFQFFLRKLHTVFHRGSAIYIPSGGYLTHFTNGSQMLWLKPLSIFKNY